jgi:regulator of sirC expression with transglutaminase-like and TPR domain
MGYEARMDAEADFIQENQEFTEDDIAERDEQIKELKEIARVAISVIRHQRLKDRTLERFISYFKKSYKFTEEDFTSRNSWMNEIVEK